MIQLQMQKQKIVLIIGVALALIAVFMVKVYLDQQRELIREQVESQKEQIRENEATVLVAKKDIPEGSTINPDSLALSTIPRKFVQPQAVGSPERIAGMITVAPISKDEQITLTKLKWPKDVNASPARGGSSLASATPIGKRAITISVDNIAALAGMIKPSDYVDVIATVPVPMQTQEGKQVTQATVIPLFQNILVLAVGQNTGAGTQDNRYKKDENSQSTSLITLALNPQEANIIAFVQEQGKIRLILRSPADSQVQPFQAANWDTVFQYVMPDRGAAQEAQKKETMGMVEIYRGLNKEIVPLPK